MSKDLSSFLTVRAEEVAHVLDDAEHRHIDLAEHVEALAGVEKGDVLGVARLAGIMGAKRTSDLIPLCHPLPLTSVVVDFELDTSRSSVDITATAHTTAKTGVEMEAMTAVSVAALTIYDMCKAVDRGMRIEAVRLVRKSGGRSGLIELD